MEIMECISHAPRTSPKGCFLPKMAASGDNKYCSEAIQRRTLLVNPKILTLPRCRLHSPLRRPRASAPSLRARPPPRSAQLPAQRPCWRRVLRPQRCTACTSRHMKVSPVMRQWPDPGPGNTSSIRELFAVGYGWRLSPQHASYGSRWNTNFVTHQCQTDSGLYEPQSKSGTQMRAAGAGQATHKINWQQHIDSAGVNIPSTWAAALGSRRRASASCSRQNSSCCAAAAPCCRSSGSFRAAASACADASRPPWSVCCASCRHCASSSAGTVLLVACAAAAAGLECSCAACRCSAWCCQVRGHSCQWNTPVYRRGHDSWTHIPEACMNASCAARQPCIDWSRFHVSVDGARNVACAA